MGHPTVDLHSFFANTDLATFLIQIPIQLKKIVKITTWRVFWSKKKIAQDLKKPYIRPKNLNLINRPVLWSQNYLFAAPAPAPLFTLFWLHLQPFVAT